MKKIAKYRNKKTAGFASKREAKRAQELQLLEKAGKIANLQFQVPFELIPAQYEFGTMKLLERSCRYICDFLYYRTDVHIAEAMCVEDTKGVKTADYIIKRKLMLKVHGIRIKEI